MEVLLIYYASFLIGILIHEVGHAIAVLCTGHRIIEFSVGPICLKRIEGNYRVSLRGGIFTGLIRYDRDFARTSWRSEVLIICSGVLANFIVGGIFLAYFLAFSANAFFAIFGSISLLLGLINLFPVRSKSLGVDSDARRFIDMITFARNINNWAYKYILMGHAPVKLRSKDDILQSPYEIEFLNDDGTPMEYVVCVLKNVFEMDDYAAAVLMMAIHANGAAKIGWTDIDSAIGCVERINQKARDAGYPFSCRVVPLPG